jgi:peptidoglycan hydrolase FlgJ
MLGRVEQNLLPELAVRSSEPAKSMQGTADDLNGLKTVAQEFESFMLNAMLKSMREATLGDGLGDNDQTRMYTGMLDQQFAGALSKQGVGLADVLVRQLAQQGNSAELMKPSVVPQVQSGLVRREESGNALNDLAKIPGNARAFIERMRPHADQASKTTGIPADFILGQAALESGWGRREIRNSDGGTSFNLFGIKATGTWRGQTADTMTTEYVDGRAEKRVEKFRAYGSYGEAFADYARLLKGNPRYANAIASAGDASSFAEQIARAGYATDPKYAEKLKSVIRLSVMA